MGFSNVAWESRSAEQLARDLTEGAGPTSVGQAGAAWVRVADELAGISTDYDMVVDKIKNAFESHGADAAAQKLNDFSQWLQAVSLSAAGNGERAEESAVAYGVAVASMPSVSQAVVAKTTQRVMSSLAAYNGAILNGQFAEFDEAAGVADATASAAMYQYEEACSSLAKPWDQPLPPDVANGIALQAEQRAHTAADGGHAAGGTSGVGTGHVGSLGSVPVVLASFRAGEVTPTGSAQALQQVRETAAGASTPGTSAMGGGYGPMGALGRVGTSGREYQSSLPTASLDDVGEAGASLTAGGGMPWLPTAQQSDDPFVVSDVSWGPNTSVFDELAAPEGMQPMSYADEPEREFEQVSNHRVSPAVLGVDKELTL